MNFETEQQARLRLQDPKDLTEDEARALIPLLGGLVTYPGHAQRIHLDLALQQIAAINRFNKTSGRLMAISIIASFCQVLVAAVVWWTRH